MLPYCFFTHRTFPEVTLEKMKKVVTPVFSDETLASDILEKVTVASASAIIGFDSKWFDKLPNLKLITVFGVGTDKVDLVEARKRGIDVTTTLNILTDAVADMAIALLFASMREVVMGNKFVRDKEWTNKKSFPLSASVRGKKLGIVGLGAIGTEIARVSEAFNMVPSYYNRTKKTELAWKYYDDLVELAKDSDILVVAISATPQTQKIINQSVLEALGPNGTLINIARGAVIDEDALIEALQTKKIARAGLDVFMNEPNIDERFMALDNIVLTPHQASATIETREDMGQNVIDNIVAFLSGKPLLTLVNK